MIGLLALAQAAGTPAPAATVAVPPADWSQLSELQYVRRVVNPPEIAQFVRDEVAAGRCTAARPAAKGWQLHIELAVQLDQAGFVRRIIPRAIQCATVEQYASGVVLAMARNNTAGAGGWYRTSLTFAWAG